MNEYKTVCTTLPKRSEIFNDEDHFVTAEMRDKICKDALCLDDEMFEINIGNIRGIFMIEDCFFSEELIHLKFAIRAFKFIWEELSLGDDWDCVLERICEITVEWIDVDDYDFQQYLLEVRDILRENFGKDMSDFDCDSDTNYV